MALDPSAPPLLIHHPPLESQVQYPGYCHTGQATHLMVLFCSVAGGRGGRGRGRSRGGVKGVGRGGRTSEGRAAGDMPRSTVQAGADPQLQQQPQQQQQQGGLQSSDMTKERRPRVSRGSRGRDRGSSSGGGEAAPGSTAAAGSAPGGSRPHQAGRIPTGPPSTAPGLVVNTLKP